MMCYLPARNTITIVMPGKLVGVFYQKNKNFNLFVPNKHFQNLKKSIYQQTKKTKKKISKNTIKIAKKILYKYTLIELFIVE